MQHFGIIVQGKLVVVYPDAYPEAKILEYAEVPEYDQQTQYVIQSPPEDRGDYIFVGVEIRDLEPDENDATEN